MWKEKVSFLWCFFCQCIVYWTNFQNIHTFTYKKILVQTLVFKFAESLKCILNTIMIFFNVIWAIKKYKLKILFHNNHFFFYTKDTVINGNTSFLTFQYTCSYMCSFLRLIRCYITFSISNSGPFLAVYSVWQ